MTPARLHRLIVTVADAVIAHEPEFTALDQAIGDGDHGLNMRRGFETVRSRAAELADKPLPEAVTAIGQQLVLKIGGASGPLYGTLLIVLGRDLAADGANFPQALHSAITAVMARGRSQAGQKTMLDVLAPVQQAVMGWRRGTVAAVARDCRRGGAGHGADAGDARPGFVPGRPVGGSCRSRCAVLGGDRCGRMQRVGGVGLANVGIVIVSHSAKIAEGAADMVRQMVGDSVPLAFSGGDAGGGLGTSAASILRAIDAAWSEAGVAILVDLGGAETNSEMAVEMLGPERRGRVVVCDAPIVEGAVIAAAEASGGSSLDTVRRVAEQLSPQ